MLLKQGDKGIAVKRLQEFLTLIPTNYTYELVPDGDYGNKTFYAVKEVQKFFNDLEGEKVLDEDGIAGPKTLKKVYEFVGADDSGCFVYEENGVTVVDGRGCFDPPKNYHGYVRDWKTQIDSVVLHQTGCAMPQNIAFWSRVNAHIGVTRKGVIYLMHPWEYQIWHAQDLSKNSIGIEIEGNMRGIEGNDKTYWRAGGGPHSLSEAQERALNDVLYHLLVAGFEGTGGTWAHVWAHRQSSSDRQADPGSKIWQKIGMEWQDRLGIPSNQDIDVVTNSGMPIPKEWSIYSKNSYWG